MNFPRIIELEGDRLVLAYGKGRHTGVETRPVAISEDFGRTWTDSPPGFPMADNVQTSGILGYMGDGTIAYIDVFPVNTGWSQTQGLYHQVAKIEDPIFRLRRFSRKGDLLADDTFKVNGIPWGRASYELYGTLLTLENGDLLTAFGGPVGTTFTTFIVRSKDGGESFEYVTAISPEVGGGDGSDQALAEADLEVLANGDILCMMRTGSDTPMRQSRSTDGGRTWSEAVSIGWPGVKPHLRLLSSGGPGVQLRTGRLWTPTGHVRHVQHRWDGRGVGIPAILPHGAGLLLHIEYGARRQALRRILSLVLHETVRRLRASLPLHQVGCNRRCVICFDIGKEADMRRRRTMYLDDARHYYLYVFEPPMTMEEAWLPVE